MSLQKYVVSFPQLEQLLLEELESHFGSDIELFQGGFLDSWVHMLGVLAENDLFYSSMLANESYLSRALLQSSILEHAKSLGYTVVNATPASGSVTLHIPIQSVDRFKIDLSASQFRLKDSQENIYYTNPNRLTIFYDARKGINYSYVTNSLGNVTTLTSYIAEVNITDLGTTLCYNIQVPVQQADWINYTYVLHDSDVANNKTPQIDVQISSLAPTASVENYFIGEVNVSVNAIAYSKYDFLFSIPRNISGYVLNVSTDKVTVVLGNGIFGVKQRAGATVLVQIPLTLGARGNVNDNALKLVTNLVDTFTSKVQRTYVSHSAIKNGVDGESIGTTRLNTIRSIRSLERMVSDTDIPDLVAMHYSDQFIDAHPISKVSDLRANETSVFLVPQIVDPSIGKRALKCNSIVYECSRPEVDYAIIAPGTTIVGTSGSYPDAPDATGVCPFEVYYTTSPEWIDYRYLLTDVYLTPTVVSQVNHTDDYLTTASIPSYFVTYDEYILDKPAYFIEATFNLKTSAWANLGTYLPTGYDTSGFDSLYDFNTYQLNNGGVPTVFDLSVTFTDVRNAANVLTLSGNDWKIKSWTDRPDQSTVVLVARLNSSSVGPITYKADTRINATLNNVTQTIHVSNIISVVFKTSLKELFSTSIDHVPGYRMRIYDVPIIEPAEWEAFKIEINTSLLSQMNSFRDFVRSRRMVTNKIVTPFAKTWGTLSNFQYNPSTSQYVYDPTCIDTIELPLKIAISIVVRTDYDAASVSSQVREDVWSYLQAKFAIHQNIYLKDIERIILSVPGVLDAEITNPTVNIVYEFDPKVDVPGDPDMKGFVTEFIWVQSKNDIVITLLGQVNSTC